MTSQFDLTRFHDFIIRKSVILLCFLTREFQISLNIHSFVRDKNFQLLETKNQVANVANNLSISALVASDILT